MASPPRLLSTFSWISRYAKPILVNGSNVNVMYSPHDYYNCVKVHDVEAPCVFTT